MKRRDSGTARVKGETLKKLMRQRGLLPGELADMTWDREEGRNRVGERTIEKMMAGGRVRIPLLREVAGTLGVRYEELVDEEAAPPSQPSANGQPAQASIVDPSDAMGMLIGIMQEFKEPSGYTHETEFFAQRLKALLEEQADRRFDTHTRLLRQREREEKAEAEAEEAKNKPVDVFYVPGKNRDGEQIYAYFVVASCLHDMFMESLANGKIPEYAVRVAHGKGEPTPEVREYMRTHYGYDLDSSPPGEPG